MERLQREFDVQIVHRHFPLHPDTPASGLTLEELFAGRDIDLPAAKAKMAALMAEEGLPYGERTMTYNSRLAQELAKWAETQPGGDAIHQALYQAYFVDNTNLADIDNLVGIAARLGLSADAARDSLTQRKFADAVDADWQRSRNLGITGVPTFVAGNQGLVGAQPLQQLVALVEASGARRRDA